MQIGGSLVSIHVTSTTVAMQEEIRKSLEDGSEQTPKAIFVTSFEKMFRPY